MITSWRSKDCDLSINQWISSICDWRSAKILVIFILVFVYIPLYFYEFLIITPDKKEKKGAGR